MKQHKWHKEIKAWADGQQIQYRSKVDEGCCFTWTPWQDVGDSKYPPAFLHYDDFQYRIKPQPKEPQYLYVYLDDDYEFSPIKLNTKWTYIGKLKLEEEV